MPNFDPIAFFLKYPDFFLRAISLYYPLPLEWLRKYGEVLHWGAVISADISLYASQEFREHGIIFNRAIDWDDESRSLLFAHLAIKGGDLALTNGSGLWANTSKSSGLSVSKDRTRKLENLADFVQNCQ